MNRGFDAIVLGGGAAGLMCALTAGRRGRRVLVLERANRIGKKILMSGGGRCNFTNLHVSPDRYLSANPHFCKSALARYTQWDFIDLVQRHAIDYLEKETVHGLSGQLFCRDSSKRIVSMLREECEGAGVEILTGCETHAVEHPGRFQLRTTAGVFESDALVVACGGLSVPSLGGSGFGYDLARQFGLAVLDTAPGLVPLTFSGPLQAVFSRLAGVSCEASLRTSGATFREDLLFTHRGLSGPAVLQISSYWQPGAPVTVGLLPGLDLAAHLLDRKRAQGRATLRAVLADLLPRNLVRELEALWWPDRAGLTLAEWPDRLLQEAAGRLQAWAVRPAGTEGYRTAEVTLGGVDTGALSSRTMESPVSGLFFIGEVVDVTGQLGGFNFQWAWSSGHAAGQAL